MKNRKSLAVVVLLVFFSFNYVNCLHDVVLRMPEIAHAGDAITLRVEYKLDSDDTNVYNIKYYKDGEEFFRHDPHQPPYDMVFQVPAVKVDTARSSNTTVVLMDVIPLTSGYYTVEINMDAPTFDTIKDLKTLKVHPKPTGFNSTSNVTNPNQQLKKSRHLLIMESKIGRKESWPKFITDLIFGKPKEGYELIKMAAFGYLNHISPHDFGEVLRETGAYKDYLDSTAAVFSLYHSWDYSRDIRRMTTSYSVERQGYFTLDDEPSSNPVDNAKSSCDCKCNGSSGQIHHQPKLVSSTKVGV